MILGPDLGLNICCQLSALQIRPLMLIVELAAWGFEEEISF